MTDPIAELTRKLESLECPYPGIVEFAHGFDCAKARMLAIMRELPPSEGSAGFPDGSDQTPVRSD